VIRRDRTAGGHFGCGAGFHSGLSSGKWQAEGVVDVGVRVMSSKNMRGSLQAVVILAALALAAPWDAARAATEPGDANDDGIVDMEDVRHVLQYLVHEVPLAETNAADASQDGKIDVDDAFIIARHLGGESLIVYVDTPFGGTRVFEAGSMLVVQAFESFFPAAATNGTIRIRSESAGYDSGVQPMSLVAGQRSYLFHWDTLAALPAADYVVRVTIGDDEAEQVVALAHPSFGPPSIADAVDAQCPGAGFPLQLRRFIGDGHNSYPLLGPFGRSWKPDFAVKLDEFADGTVLFHGRAPFHRYYRSRPDGSYESPVGDYSTLTFTGGCFRLEEKSGLAYQFRDDLQALFMEDRNGNRLTFGYDEQGRVTNVLHSSGDALTVRYNSQGRITNLVDHVGRVTLYEYDAGGQHLVRVTGPGGDTTTCSYYTNAHYYINDRLKSVTFADGTEAHYEYDEQGRVVRTTGKDGVNAVTFAYEADGVTRIRDVFSNETIAAYTVRRQPVLFTDALGHSISNRYDALFNRIEEWDAFGRPTRYAYDANGNMTNMVDAAGHAFAFRYDADTHKLLELRDSRGALSRFVYDALGNLLKAVFADGTEETYVYNARGLPTSKTTRSGAVMSYAYDGRGVLLSRTYPGGARDMYEYDAAGRLAQASNTIWAISNVYDEADRLVRVTYPGGRSFVYAYDGGDRQAGMTDPDGRNLGYAYDRFGFLSAIREDATGALVAAYDRDAGGRVTRKRLGNGTFADYRYDALNRLSAILHYGPTTNLLIRFSYSYDPRGNVSSCDTLEGIEYYAYDEIGQLTNATGSRDSWMRRYAYDAMGNRTSSFDGQSEWAYGVNNLNQYTNIGASACSYDANGNLAQRQAAGVTNRYTFDAENRLVRVETASVTNEYGYDPLGCRVLIRNGTGAVYQLWSGGQVVLEESAAHGTLGRWVWGAVPDEVVRMDRGAARTYYAQDARQSVVGLTDASGGLCEEYRYAPFGEPLGHGTNSNPWRYGGLAYDDVTGLQYHRARYYSPDMGRFLSVDPMGMAGGINIYAYARNSPLQFVDRTGLGVGDMVEIYRAMGEAALTFSGAILDAVLAVAEAVVYVSTVSVQMQWAYSLSGADGGASFGAGNITHATPTTSSRSAAIGGKYAVRAMTGYGYCPTFVQPPAGSAVIGGEAAFDPQDRGLAARIIVPPDGSLLRSDIPVYGYAGGRNFARFRVEFGRGRDPAEWHLLRSSDHAEESPPDLRDVSWMQGDLDLRGNLATWNTGLKNWEHLPWHPADDPTDLNGAYTVRLVVEGKDGQTVEDRVTCEVGRAIAQCLPGRVVSPDGVATMRFPEQGLLDKFRVFTILPFSELDRPVPEAPAGMQLLTEPYRVREPGEKFIKDIVLEFAAPPGGTAAPDRTGLCRYDATTQAWIWLPTDRDESGKTYRTILQELPAPDAVYALAADATPGRSTVAQAISPPEPLIPAGPGILLDNTFDRDLGSIRPRDRLVGAALARVERAAGDGCLELKKERFGGNFSFTVLDRPFDVREYPQFSFDYRIDQDIKIDIYLRVHGRWHRLRFTDDPVDTCGQDLNISTLGAIPGIMADGQWRSASVDLARFLRRKTRHTQVEEIIFADWDVGGYMALEFGRNRRDATFWLDRIRLAAGGREHDGAVLCLDDYDRDDGRNRLGLPAASYGSDGQACQSSRAQANSQTGSCLALDVDVSRRGAYGGYWSGLGDRDLRGYDWLCFDIRCDEGLRPAVSLKDADGRETAISMGRYVSSAGGDGWSRARIPLQGFSESVDIERVAVVAFGFSDRQEVRKGRVLLDNVRFEPQDSSPAPELAVADFEGAAWERNLMGGRCYTFENGAAGIRCSSIAARAGDDQGRSLMVAYGGSIGLDLGPDGFSYCGWGARLGGLDLSGYQVLEMRLRGQEGGEKPNVYLGDGVVKRGLDVEKYSGISTGWAVVCLPLADFAARGIDLTHVENMEMTFEWDRMSGSLWVDDVGFR